MDEKCWYNFNNIGDKMKKNQYIWIIVMSVLIVAALFAVSYIQGKDENIPIPIYTLQNGGFENGTSGWAMRHGYSLDTKVFHSGNASARADPTYYDPAVDPTKGDARASWISKSVYVQEGQQVFASAWIKTEQATCTDGLRIGIDFKAINSTPYVINGQFVTWGNNWTYRTINGTVPTGKGVIRITLWLQGKPYDCPAKGWFDDIELKVYNQSVAK